MCAVRNAQYSPAMDSRADLAGPRALAGDTGSFSDYAVRLMHPQPPQVPSGALGSPPSVCPSPLPRSRPIPPLQSDLGLFFGIQAFFFLITPAIIMVWRLLLNWRDGFMAMFKVRKNADDRAPSFDAGSAKQRRDLDARGFPGCNSAANAWSYL
jgi:hypothetical protein